MHKPIISLIWACLIFSVFCQCQKQPWEEHYERPEWLRGNAWEVLEARGNFEIFLEAAERAGYKNVLTGKVIATVMAPNDQAMQQYFQAHDIASVEGMPIAQLRKLIGFHLVYYAYDRAKFSNYQPQGVDNAIPANAGLHYKHRTRSQDTVSVWRDPVSQLNRTVYHKERFLPVISSTLFSTKGIDAKRNYEYFYPQSTWNAGASEFHISDAYVEEYAIATDNGYVYLIDRVLEPLETVHKLLSDEQDYSTFMKIYDRFIEFWYDAPTSAQYSGLADSLFIVRHGALPQIASEWSYNGEDGQPDYANLGELSYKAFNVFAPNNQALSQFFEAYWSSYYPSIDDVGFLPLSLLLNNHVYQGNVVFPDEIAQGNKITSSYGNPITFDPYTEVATKGIGTNGVYYGLNKVIVPNMFYSVTGPLLQNPDYKMFLHMAANANIIQPLMSDVVEYTLFVPEDEVILNTLYGDSYLFWNEGHPLRYGDEAVEVENSEGIRVPMSQSAMNQFVSNHIASGRITQFAGKQVFRTRNPFNYLYVTQDGVASSASYNNGMFFPVRQIPGSWTNGLVYATDAALLREPGSIKFMIGGATTATSPLQEFSEFAMLLNRAGLLPSGSELSFLLGERFLLFAPSNEAIREALTMGGIIPEDNTELAEYLKYYFVPINENSLSDYPFPGFGVQGEWRTAHLAGGMRSRLTLTDQGATLQLRDATGQVAQVVSEFPKTFNDGAIYQIDRLLSLN
ncbi:fasciclin domain-containing protein [Parapedobacter tibetensis]|uniref:fasciclin domain-containing protein n=1 Tax=Parapedobacter tibetensis TaxID=2972951 RepID=UPI00214D94E5|nr:fasciclin domain-containing protein [Parapedobacter tibetensis]